MNIDIERPLAGHRWFVHMDSWEAGFNSQAEAESFVRLLKSRIEAPHPWPSAGRHAPAPGSGQARPLARRLPAGPWDAGR